MINNKEKIIYQNSSQIVELLIAESEAGNISKLTELFDANEINANSLDEAFRACIRSFKNGNDDYLKTVRFFLRKIENINYQNEKYNNTTVLMCAISLGMYTPADKIISCYKYFDGEQKLNVNVVDNNGENCLFKLLTCQKFISEDERYEIFQALITENVEINHQNKDGYTLLSYSLIMGNPIISEELIKFGANKSHVISLTGDTLLHCAVRGKNPLCVSLLQANNSMGFTKDLAHKNNSEDTPYDLAAKMNLHHIVKILTQTKALTILQLLEEFTNKNYLEVLKQLNESKNEHKFSSMSHDWNTLLVEFMYEYDKERQAMMNIEIESKDQESAKISSNNNNIKSNQNVIFASSSFFDHQDSMVKKPNIITSFYKKIIQFFANINNYQDYSFDNNQIITLNNAILNYKLGDYKSMLNLISTHLHKSSKEQDWMFYVNASLLTIDVFLNFKQIKMANKIILKLEEFLKGEASDVMIGGNEINETESESLPGIVTAYLNSREIVSKSEYMDDSWCILALYKCYKFSLEDKLEEAKKSLKEYKRIITNSKFKDNFIEFPIFSTLKVWYSFLKIKIDYQNNSSFKCYKHLNSLYSTYIAKKPYEVDRVVYYYNTVGILNLKLKKYKLAEYFFKHCESIIKQTNNVNSISLIKSINNYLPCISYNIGLCHFYNKRYEKAYKIFKYVSGIRNFNINPFVYYRIGLCCLEKELSMMKSIGSSISYNEFIDKFIGYTRNESVSKHESGNDFVYSLSNDLNDDSSSTLKQNQAGSSSPSEACDAIKRIILRNSSPSENWKNKVNNERLSEAVNSFKQALMLLKDNVYYKKEMSTVSILFENAEDSSEVITSLNPIYLKSYQQLFVSSYINMLFCLLLKEQWNEVIFYAHEFEKTEFYSRELGYIIDNYVIEAHLSLNQVLQGLEILKKNMFNNNFNYNSLDCKGTFFTRTNSALYSELNYKLALYINIIKMNFINNNLVEVEKGIISIVNLMNLNLSMNNGVITHNDLPPFLVNMLVYYCIAKENYEMACSVIKKRKIPTFLAQTILQPTHGKIPIPNMMK